MVRHADRSLGDRMRAVRVGPLREGAFKSALHTERVAAILGLALGITFAICFLTGLLSHLIQHPPNGFVWPSRPAGLYRVTQGLHVVTGLASIPLLLGKLWAVYPQLWAWPPIRSMLHAVERISLVPLVAGSIFLLFTGLANIGLWHPWRFFFPAGHYSAAWITTGALVVHVGAKGAQAWSAVRSRPSEPDDSTEGLTRRGFLGTVFGTAGVITLVTAGQTLRPLNRIALLAPRRPDVGPQGFPVNQTASTHIIESAHDPAYTLLVGGNVPTPLSLSLDELRALDQYEAELPIACVEGWSTSQRWRGVRVANLLDAAGARGDASVRVESLQAGGLYRSSLLNPSHARDPDTLLALEVNRQLLHINHGFPIRLIGPNRPGVMQTKWVGKLVVL
jgi:DMSO/TMAO reductase YedYZ molybdopterin-dependent catalytic subunit